MQNYKMDKNIDFKGLLNTVPYFLCGGMCGNYEKISGWIVEIWDRLGVNG